MANELDEITGPTNPEGRDVNVIDKQLKVEVGAGTKFFEVALHRKQPFYLPLREIPIAASK